MHERAVNFCVHHTALLSSVNKYRGTEHFIITGSRVNKAAFVKRQLKMHSAVRRQETASEGFGVSSASDGDRTWVWISRSHHGCCTKLRWKRYPAATLLSLMPASLSLPPLSAAI